MNTDKVVFIFTPTNGESEFRFRCVNSPKVVMNYLKKLLKLKTDAQVHAHGTFVRQGEVGGPGAARSRGPATNSAQIGIFRFTPNDGRNTIEFRAPNTDVAVTNYLSKRGYDVTQGELLSNLVAPEPIAPPSPPQRAPRPTPAQPAAQVEAAPSRGKKKVSRARPATSVNRGRKRSPKGA